jgi:hypothetical protein
LQSLLPCNIEIIQQNLPVIAHELLVSQHANNLR